MKANNEDEICEKTKLKRESCYHCQAKPEYQMIESTYKGAPVVEILYKGGPIHEFDSHFRFGKSRAKLLIACIDILEELADTSYGEVPNIVDQKVADLVNGDLILVEVKIFREMQHSSGRIINVPWVRLQSRNYLGVHIGLGRKKAKAIMRLRKQLSEWAI